MELSLDQETPILRKAAAELLPPIVHRHRPLLNLWHSMRGISPYTFEGSYPSLVDRIYNGLANFVRIGSPCEGFRFGVMFDDEAIDSCL
jgi:hypothetical protein